MSTFVSGSASLKSYEAHWARSKAKSSVSWDLPSSQTRMTFARAPALDIIRELIAAGATVRAHDPIAIPNAQAALHGKDETTNPELHFTENVYELSYDADALVLITEWDFYHKLELRRLAKQMKTPILIDGRNVYSPEEARTAGFHYIGVGRV